MFGISGDWEVWKEANWPQIEGAMSVDLHAEKIGVSTQSPLSVSSFRRTCSSGISHTLQLYSKGKGEPHFHSCFTDLKPEAVVLELRINRPAL